MKKWIRTQINLYFINENIFMFFVPLAFISLGEGVWRGAEVGEGSYVLSPLPAFPIRSRFPGEETEPVLGL